MKKIIFTFFFITSSLFAGHSGEIYTYGYFIFIRDTLLALSGIVAGGNDILFKLAMALAMFIWVFKNITNPKAGAFFGFEFAKFLTTVVLIQQLFLTAPDDDKHAYAIVDRITTQTTEVRQIPKGIGELLSLFTRLEDAIMEKMDIYFSTPNSISYRNAGLGFSMIAPMEIFQQTVLDGNLRKTFTLYYENCKMLGDYSDSTQAIDNVYTSTDIWNELATDQTLLSVIYDSTNPDGSVTECKNVWTNIQSRVDSSLAAQLNALAKAKGMDSATYSAKAQLVASTMLSSAQSAQEQLKGAILRNMTLEAVQTSATSLGIAQAQLAKNKSIAEMSMVNEAMFSNLEAQGMIPIMKAVVLSFVIALSWILAIFSIATLNMSYLKFVLTLNVWIMLWGPLFNVLNYAMDLMVSDALSAYSGGVAIDSQMGIYTILGAKLALLSKLVWSVPILAFAIAKGSDHAMVSFVQSMGQGVATGGQLATRAEQQGAQSGKVAYTDLKEQFSVSAGSQGKITETSYAGAYGAGKESVSSGKSGDTVKKENVGGATSVTANGENIGLDVNGKVNANQTRALSETRDQAIQNVKSTMQGTGSTDSAAIQKMTTASESYKNGNSSSVAEGVSKADSDTIGKTVKHAYDKATTATYDKDYTATITNGKGQTEKVGFKIGVDGSINWDSGEQAAGWVAEKVSGASLHAKLGAGASFDKSGDLQIKMQDGTTQTIKTGKSFKEDFQTAFNKDIKETISTDKKAAQAWTAAHDTMNGTSASDAKTHQEQISNAFETRDQATEAYSNSISLNNSISHNSLAGMFRNELSNNDILRETYLNKNGEFKDLEAQKGYTQYVQSKLDYWSQGGNTALQDFADFANANGTSNINAPINNNGLNTNVTATVDGAINNTKINTPTNGSIQENINRNKESYEMANESNVNRSFDMQTPTTFNNNDVNTIDNLNSNSVVNNVNANSNQINSSIDAKSGGLVKADPMLNQMGFGHWGEGLTDGVKSIVSGTDTTWTTLNQDYGVPGGSGRPYDYAGSNEVTSPLKI
jgi:conjugal transfer mating pair stabilization protein TraG